MQFVEAANHWVGREGQKPRFLVIHGTAGGTSAVAIANYFAQSTTEASTNYVIGTAGEVVMCVREEDAPWANGALTARHAAFWDVACGGLDVNGNPNINPNLISISIEHCKPSLDNSDTLTPPQQAASFPLVEEICNRWGIPKRPADANGGITGHYSLDPVNRSRCPGPYPFDDLIAYLNRPAQGEEMPLTLTDPLGTHFVQSGTTKWTCKQNKIDVQGAILVYFLMIQGACRLPLTAEQYNIPGVVWQKFESGILVYDPQQKLDGYAGHNHTYMVKIDSDLAQKVLFSDKLKAATDAETQAIAAKKVSDDKVLALGQQLAELKAAQPVNKDRLKINLNNIQAAVNDSLTALN